MSPELRKLLLEVWFAQQSLSGVDVDVDKVWKAVTRLYDNDAIEIKIYKEACRVLLSFDEGTKMSAVIQLETV